MFSNKHKYTLLRISRVLFAPIYSVISIFLKKNDNIIITASLNKEYSDNARALFEILISNVAFRDRVYFVINDDVVRLDLNKIYPGRFISNKDFKSALFILRAKFWFCSAMELPLATFFQRSVRQVIHLGHGMLYKKIGLLESNVSWYKKIYYKLITSSFTYTIATTPFCRKYISRGFGLPESRVLLTPQPKTAHIHLSKEIKDPILSDKEQTHILYAPTWRPYANVELFPFDDLNLPELSSFLTDNGVHIWLRVHPRFEQHIDKKLVNISNIHLFSAKDFSEINLYLAHFDALITDYSSIYFDYITLNRPVLFFDYDLEKYNEVVGVIDEYALIKSNDTTTSQKQFIDQLLEIKNGSFDLTKVKEVNKQTNFPIDNSEIKEVVLDKLLLGVNEQLK